MINTKCKFNSRLEDPVLSINHKHAETSSGQIIQVEDGHIHLTKQCVSRQLNYFRIVNDKIITLIYECF